MLEREKISLHVQKGKISINTWFTFLLELIDLPIITIRKHFLV